MIISELGSDTFLNGHKLFLGEREMCFLEVEVALGTDWHKMDMGMRHLKSDDSHADAFARDGLFDGESHVFGEHHHLTELLVIDIEKVVRFLFRDDEGMPFGEGVDIEKGKKLVILSDFIAGDFTLDDSREDGGHSGGKLGVRS